MRNPYIYMKCEGRRWYVWDEQARKWERATIVHGVSHRIVQEVERLIIQAVREDDFEEARVWRRYLYHGDIGTWLARTCRASTGRTKRYPVGGGRPG